MRKLALMLLLMLLTTSIARAEALPQATKLDMHKSFERYQSYELDEETGAWSAYGRIAGQLVSTIEQGGASGYMGNGVCVMYPGIRGNRDLSLIEPVLYVCLLKTTPIEADALSITTGDMRYDFVGSAEKIKIGKYACERFALPLGEEGVQLLKAFAEQGGEVRVYGEQRVYRTSIHEAERYKNTRQRIEAMSVGAVRDFLPQWMHGYTLWDLNEAHWGEERPKMAAVALDERTYGDGLPKLEKDTQCVDTTKGTAVRAYQQLLKDGAFITIKPDSSFGKITRNATKQAQQYYDLLPTGMPDRTLIELLSGVEQPIDEVKPSVRAEPLTASMQTKPGVIYVLDGLLSIRLDRAWEARSISPSHSSDALERFWPADRSNQLCAIDGEIVNLSTQSLQLSSVLQGFVQVNGGATYSCTIQCERDMGHTFGAGLLPLGKSRLLMLCEVPAGIELTSCVLYVQIQSVDTVIEMQFEL